MGLESDTLSLLTTLLLIQLTENMGEYERDDIQVWSPAGVNLGTSRFHASLTVGKSFAL